MYTSLLQRFCCLLIFLVPAMLSACVSSQYRVGSPNVSITTAENVRIKFSGKGSAAGVMLAGSMGPMGIAIGVAIDEGIGKDIHSAFTASGHSIASLAFDSVQHVLNQHCQKDKDAQPKLCSHDSQINVHVEKIGFALVPGDDEPLAPEFELTLTLHDNDREISIVNADYNEQCEAVTLDQAKQDGEGSYQLLKCTLVDVFLREFKTDSE